MYLTLTRFQQDDYQTLGTLEVMKNFTSLFKCMALELPWKDNQRNISRIPSGIYMVVKHISPTFGESLWIQGVPNRSEILIHVANFRDDLRGCVGVGEQHIDINNDGYKDVTNSRFTIKELYNIVEQELSIEIIERWEN